MHPLLRTACAQADRAISVAIARPVPVPTRPSDRADLASAAPRALHMDAQALAGRLDLTGTWLESVTARSGFLNFTLSPAWYEAAAACPPEVVPIPALSPVSVNYPGKIAPFDWHFLTALRGRVPDPALAARQDAANSGALLRLTLRRLEQVEGRVPPETVWREEHRRLLLLLAQFEPKARPKRQAIYLEAVARQAWDLGPLHLSAPLLCTVRGVLTQGCAALLRATEGTTEGD